MAGCFRIQRPDNAGFIVGFERIRQLNLIITALPKNVVMAVLHWKIKSAVILMIRFAVYFAVFLKTGETERMLLSRWLIEN
jgi:hypothetical protein